MSEVRDVRPVAPVPASRGPAGGERRAVRKAPAPAPRESEPAREPVPGRRRVDEFA